MKRRAGLVGLVALALLWSMAPAAAQDTGQISGVVLEADTGEPISGMWVVARTLESYGFGSRTNANGEYTITGVTPGEWMVGTGSWIQGWESSPYVQVWWPDADAIQAAAAVEVTAGGTTDGIDLETVVGGVVTGTVRNAWTGDPVDVGSISITRLYEGEWDGYQHYQVASNGTFRAEGLNGQYALRYEELNTGFLPTRGETFQVEPGEEMSMDLLLTPAYGSPYATIEGSACEVGRGATGCWAPGAEPEFVALDGVVVQARSADGRLLGTTTTDSTGHFLLEELEPGKIVVSMVPPPGMELVDSLEYELKADEWGYGDGLMAQRLEVRHGLNSWLGFGATELGEDATWTLEAVFVGVAGSLDRFDLTNVMVAVHLPDGVEYVGHVGEGPFDPTTGIWTVPVLPYVGRARMTITVRAAEEGSYRLSAEVVESDWPERAETFGDGRGVDFTTDDLIVQPAPVDVDLGVIGGLVWLDDDRDGVFDSDETGLKGLTVVVTDSDEVTTSVETSPDGRYSVSGLAAGSYQVAVDSESLPDGVEEVTAITVKIESDQSYLAADFGLVEAAAPVPWWLIGVGLVVLLIGAGVVVWMTRKPAGPEAEVSPEKEPLSV